LPRRDPNSPMPHNLTLSKPNKKEKSYKNYLETQCSDPWRKHLEIVLSNPPGRVRAYVHWHFHNKHKRSLYKPAPYPTHQSSPYQIFGSAPSIPSILYLPTSIMHSGTHQLITKIAFAHTVLPQVPGSLVMSSTSYVSAPQQK